MVLPKVGQNLLSLWLCRSILEHVIFVLRFDLYHQNIKKKKIQRVFLVEEKGVSVLGFVHCE